MRNLLLMTALLAVLFQLVGCSHKPMAAVNHVDIDRFMGDWYVIANIPTLLEKGAHNAVETYEKNSDGTIATTFTFVDGSFDGKQKKYNPKGFIKDSSNAIWGMQFIWPIKADYRIVYLDEAYTRTVIGREARDYVWIMSRTPELASEEYDQIVKFVGSIGYDTSKIERVPQSWPQQQKKELLKRNAI